MSDTTTMHELSLDRVIAAPPARIWRAWTEPQLLTRWFAPSPWTVPRAEVDLRAGGTFLVAMRSPDGAEFAAPGVFLEVLHERRLVFTDAYTRAWVPSGKPFMTVIVELEPEGDTTRYAIRVRHWSEADREAHEQMGFHQGWAQCADQLSALVKTLGDTPKA